ncbi:MAG: prephenate dehydratase domain-containing protein [Eubacteriales bacterium]|nr:prephenate dehydratase domain-containing protein [Eubacteriales bacterium]
MYPTNRKPMRSPLLPILPLLLALCIHGACAEIGVLSGPVSYLGPEGTYTQEATQRFFGENGDYLPQKTVADAVRMLLDGECEFAVIPQENTIGGPVYNYLDELLAHDGVSIAGEVELPIRQALLAAEGTAPEEITVVYSHAQGIVQGKAWLAEHLPQAEVVEVSSTAEGAKMAAAAAEPGCAAIASTGAAEVYGLSVLAENIQQNEDNKTRFYILSDEEPNKARSDRMVFTATGAADELPALLGCIEENGLSLVSLHDRPEQTELGRYVYLIEVENAGYKEFEALTQASGFALRYYGAFPLR